MKFKATVINVGAYPDMRIQGYERIKHSTMQVVGDVIVLSVSEGYHTASISAQNREQFEHFVTEIKHITGLAFQ